jgi:hypothetical protein
LSDTDRAFTQMVHSSMPNDEVSLLRSLGLTPESVGVAQGREDGRNHACTRDEDIGEAWIAEGCGFARETVCQRFTTLSDTDRAFTQMVHSSMPNDEVSLLRSLGLTLDRRGLWVCT